MWSKNGDISGVFDHLCCHLLFYPQVFLVCYFSTSCLCLLSHFFLTYLHSFVHVSCFFLVFYVFASCVLLFVLINFFLFLDYSCFVTSLLISASKRYLTKLSFCFSTCRPRCPESGSCNTISIIGVQSWTGFSKPETPR